MPRIFRNLIALSLLLYAEIVFAESYKSHRFDDKTMIHSGWVELKGQGRLQKSNGDSEKKGLYADWDVFSLARGFSQKGGSLGERASRNTEYGFLQPEFRFGYQNTKWQIQILASPLLQGYRSQVQKVKTQADPDGEAILSIARNSSRHRVEFDGGRGFQRLDQAGALFAGYSNFAEIHYTFKPWNLTFSAVTLRYEPKYSFRVYDSKWGRDSVYGGSVHWNSGFGEFRSFFYRYSTSVQFARKSGFHVSSKPFLPNSTIRYYGFEWNHTWRNWHFQSSLIHTEGYIDDGEYAYQKYLSKNSNSSYFAYAKIGYALHDWEYHLGGIVARRDQVFKQDYKRDGYSGLLPNLRVLNAPSSFLLMDDLVLQEASVFPDQNTFTQPTFENAGLSFFQAGISRKIWRNLSGRLLYDRSNSRLGKGQEGILLATWEGENYFLLGSFAYAWVKAYEKKPFSISGEETQIQWKEYARLYFSAGFRF